MNQSDLNLNDLIKNGILKIESVSNEHEIDAKIRRIKDIALFVVVLLMITTIFAWSVYTLFKNPTDKYAMTFMTTIATSTLTYLLGAKSNQN